MENKHLYQALQEDTVLYSKLMSYKLPVPMMKQEFDLFNPDAAQMSIEQIVHGLSNINRYLGSTPTGMHITVAEHSCMVAKLARLNNESNEVVLGCLLHDAEEAFLGDIVKPLKDFIKENCQGFKELMAQWTRAIFEKYGVEDTEVMHTTIKKYDIMACNMELEYYSDRLMGVSKTNARHGYWFDHYSPVQAEFHLLQRIVETHKAIGNAEVSLGFINLRKDSEGSHV